MTKRIAISISAILTLHAFQALADPRVVVRDWSYETSAGRFGYWNVRDYGVSPAGTDRYFFFGPLGHFSVGNSGLIVRPKPVLDIISLSGISIAIMLWVAKWRRHGDLTAEKNGCTEPRFAGGIAVVLSGLLIVSDIEQGKRFHEKLDRLRKKATAANGEQSGPANGSQPFRSETNRTSSAAGHR